MVGTGEDGALRFAYADPPYLGCCKLYGHEHGDDGLCWDDRDTHRKLIRRLTDEYPDGWALSCSSTSLQTLLPFCPTDVRVAAWVKPFCAFKRGVRPCYGWEPVIFRGGRNPGFGHPHPPPIKGGKQTTPKDFIAESITLKKGLTGAKPEKFCAWVLDLLNVQEGDRLDDLFPGTDVMGRVVTAYLDAKGRSCAECGYAIGLDPDFGWLHKDFGPEGRSFDHDAQPREGFAASAIGGGAEFGNGAGDA